MNEQKTWRAVRERRAQLHRKQCVTAANRVIADLSALGVDAVVFGSLANHHAPFREDSDIDVCIMKNPGIEFSLIEMIARGHIKPVCMDLFAEGIAKYPQDWHMMQRIWIDGDFKDRD
jgi:predicted nucleotidyltransferase